MGSLVTNPDNFPPSLNRWLNINRVDAVERAATYITIPAFSIDATWLGYSDIVGAFHFAAPNNFSISSFVAPTTPNYTCCVSYRNSDNTVVRYRLWTATGEVIYGYIPEYVAQKIKKNFRIEIWSTSTDPVQLTAINLITSVYQLFDTRYIATNAVLIDPGSLVTNFRTPNMLLPFVFPSSSVPVINV